MVDPRWPASSVLIGVVPRHPSRSVHQSKLVLRAPATQLVLPLLHSGKLGDRGIVMLGAHSLNIWQGMLENARS